MLERFDRLQTTLLDLMRDHEALCVERPPSAETIAAVRWRLAQCGHARVRFLLDEAIPAAKRHCRAGERASVDRFIAGVAAYQAGIGAYVGRWTTAAIVAEWPSYRSAAVGFRRTVRARVAEEKALLRPILARVGVEGLAAASARSSPAPAIP